MLEIIPICIFNLNKAFRKTDTKIKKDVLVVHPFSILIEFLFIISF